MNIALQLLGDAQDGLLLLNEEDKVQYANAVALRLLGVEEDALLGRRFHVPGGGDTLANSSQACGSCSGCPACELEVSATPTRWQGRPARLVWLRDAAKGVGRELRLLKRSVESTHNGIVICDAIAPDQPIIYVNPAFERMTGYAQAEIAGRNCRFLQRDDREQTGLVELREGMRAIRDVHVVLRNFRKDGAVLWNELFVSPVLDPQGRLTHYVGVLNDITEQRRHESELLYAINHDVLTTLPNRTLLEDRLGQACQTALRFRKRVAVLFINLDGFKPINDSMGHRVGDMVLVEVARRMSRQVRGGDTVARMGGDEFLVLLANVDSEEAALGVVERLNQTLAQPYVFDGKVLHITASIGIAISDGDLERPAQLIQQADLAMYKAKQGGRNNFQWYSDDLGHQVAERLALRSELHQAIEHGGLELHYQPQIDGRSGRVAGIEALLRWLHPQRGHISPAELINASEDAGQIIPLSTWVLETACRFNLQLLEQGVSAVAVAVNISAVHFKRGDFVESIKAVLDSTGLPPSLLELEITEAVFMEETESAIATLRALKELGVKIAIDDFGTGFSSLSNLKRLPIDKVKVDLSFIKDIISDRHDANITQGIISMAHHLRLAVVAEGVETEAQYFFLRKIQCDVFQGFFFARPMPAAEMETFLRQHRVEVGSDTGGGRRQTLLLLDDEENILRALARLLRRDGYEILMASRAEDAFDILARSDVHVIITDQRMPEMSGTEFLSRVKGLYPDTVRIVLSGYTDLSTVTEAINQGEVYKFLLKPWDDEHLRSVVAEAFRHRVEAGQAREARA